MNYEEIEITLITGITEKHIIIHNGEGIPKSFPADKENPEYVAFLAQLEAEKN